MHFLPNYVNFKVQTFGADKGCGGSLLADHTKNGNVSSFFYPIPPELGKKPRDYLTKSKFFHIILYVWRRIVYISRLSDKLLSRADSHRRILLHTLNYQTGLKETVLCVPVVF